MWKLLLITLCTLCVAFDKPRWYHYIEAARPTVTVYREMSIPQFLIAGKIEHTNFHNINLIEPEQDNSPMQNESSIAVNPFNPQQLIASAVDYRANQSAWVYVSTNGGRTWRNINLGKPPIPGFTAGNDPSVAWGPEGTAYVVYGAFNRSTPPSGENAVYLARSSDGGSTWQAHIPIIIHRGIMTADSAFEDKYYITVDHCSTSPYRGRLYVPWKRVIDRDSSTQIVITWSDDKGQTWNPPVRVSPILPGTSLDTTFGQSFPLAATGPNGEAYVVWNSGTQRGIGFARSTDGGQTWSSPRLVHTYEWLGETKFTGVQYNHTLKGGTRVETYPVLVVDTVVNSPRRGWLYLTWAADRVPNVYFSRSTDGGQTWSTPRIIHQDTTGDQFWQWISLDGTNGDLAVIWLDSRDDPANLYSRVYVTYSTDGGDTWLEQPVTDTAFNIRRNPFTGGSITGVFAGDYNGCAFWNGIIYPSSVDMRHAEQNIFDSDVYSARVAVRAPEPVRNFQAKTIPSEPRCIELSWLPPQRRNFGQSLNPAEVTIMLLRGDNILVTLPATTTSYIDSTVAPYSVNHYLALAIIGRDTSSPRFAVGYAGGARQPAAPRLINVLNEETTDLRARVRLQLPTHRADGTTPLVNLTRVAVLLDGIEHSHYTVQRSDTGLTVELPLTVPERGYWHVSTCVIDDAGNRSDTTAQVIAYIGPVDMRYTDDFAQPRLHRYIVRGKWGLTNEFFYSSPHSLTESPGGNYIASSRDTLVLMPIRTQRDTVIFSMMTAAFVEERDSAIVEYSVDGSQWRHALTLNRSKYPEWGDGVRSQDDWNRITVPLPIDHVPAYVTVRLRFRSNLTVQDDGWYIDDLSIDGTYGNSVTYQKSSVVLFPNPGAEFLTIEGIDPSIVRISVVSVQGRVEIVPITSTLTGAVLDLRWLAPGVYYVRLHHHSHVQVHSFVTYGVQ